MPKTLVTFLLDRTGSMKRIKDDTIGGFNEYLEGLKEGAAADDTQFTFIQFDSTSIDKVCVNKPVKEVDKLTNETFIPRDMTPLREAAIKTIDAVDVVVKASEQQPDPLLKIEKVIICIQTDGKENASGIEYTWDRLNLLIKDKRALGWQFNFLGVGIDAYDQASEMGISAANTMSASLDPTEMKSAYRFSGRNAAAFAAGAVRDTGYTVAQKLSSGDKYGTGPAPAKPVRPFTKTRPIVDDLDLTK